jgi:hypothetical protein
MKRGKQGRGIKEERRGWREGNEEGEAGKRDKGGEKRMEGGRRRKGNEEGEAGRRVGGTPYLSSHTNRRDRRTSRRREGRAW